MEDFDFEKLRADREEIERFGNALKEIQEGKNLDKYVNDPDELIRMTVGEMDYGLDILCHDPSPIVKRRLAVTGKCLDILINDVGADVRLAVAQQNYGLEKLANDPDPLVSKEAKKRLKFIAQNGNPDN